MLEVDYFCNKCGVFETKKIQKIIIKIQLAAIVKSGAGEIIFEVSFLNKYKKNIWKVLILTCLYLL